MCVCVCVCVCVWCASMRVVRECMHMRNLKSKFGLMYALDMSEYCLVIGNIQPIYNRCSLKL